MNDKDYNLMITYESLRSLRVVSTERKSTLYTSPNNISPTWFILLPEKRLVIKSRMLEECAIECMLFRVFKCMGITCGKAPTPGFIPKKTSNVQNEFSVHQI